MRANLRSFLLLLAALAVAPSVRAADKKPKVEAKMEIIEDEPAPKAQDKKADDKKPEPKQADAKKPEATADAKTAKPKGAGGDIGPKPQASLTVEETAASVPEGTPPVPVGEEKTAIAEYIRDHTGEVHECYQRALDHRPTLQGKLYVILYIGPNGRVIGATTQGMEDQDMVRCILPQVRKWEFEKPKSGGKLFVKYPFRLVPTPAH